MPLVILLVVGIVVFICACPLGAAILGLIGLVGYGIYDELNPAITYRNPVQGSNYTIEFCLVIFAIILVLWVIAEMQQRDKTPEQLEADEKIKKQLRNSWGNIYDRDGNVIGNKGRWIR